MHTGGCTVAEGSEVVNQASGCLSACPWIGWPGSNYIIGSVDSLTADVCSYETAAVARWFDTSCFFSKLVNIAQFQSPIPVPHPDAHSK